MFTRFRLRALLPLAVIGLATLLGGCVYGPYGYGYGYPYGGYGYGYGYGYAPASVNFAFGGWGHRGWDHHWDH
jgi:hypothetical protein